jgi:hypothetical protein
MDGRQEDLRAGSSSAFHSDPVERKFLDYAGRAGIAFAASASRLNQFTCQRDK